VSGPTIDPELIRMLAATVSLDIPAEDMDRIAGYLTNVFRDAETLRQLPLEDIEPIVTMDPRWL
jgi:hypothetical protein